MRKTLFLICLFTLTLLPLTLNSDVQVRKRTGTIKIITSSHKLSEVEMEWAQSVAFSPDGRTLASGSWDATVRLWSPQTGQHLKMLAPNPRQGIESLAFSLDGKMIASGGDNRLTARLIQIWDARTGQALKICEGHVTPINSIAFSPDGKMLASASGQGHSVRLWMVND